MLAKKTKLLMIAATLLIACGAQANDIEPGSEFHSALRAPAPVVLDGNLSEWTAAAIVNPRFSIPKGSGDGGQLVSFEPLGGGDWTGPDDHSTNLQIAFDDNNVYLGIVVTDEYHENAANSGWNGDSVQLMVANDSRNAQVALYNYALGGVEGSLGNIIVDHEAGPGGTNAIVTRNSNTKLTTYEIMLPKSSLGLAALTDGVQLGLGMAINDGDQATPGQKGWSGLGAHAVVFGKTPSETALITLVPEPGSSVLFLVAIGAILFRHRKR
jgi:hypothetical protein